MDMTMFVIPGVFKTPPINKYMKQPHRLAQTAVCKAKDLDSNFIMRNNALYIVCTLQSAVHCDSSVSTCHIGNS